MNTEKLKSLNIELEINKLEALRVQYRKQLIERKLELLKNGTIEVYKGLEANQVRIYSLEAKIVKLKMSL